ncbi:hypothetical protein HaLaN_15565 [Haematococcus lacustris]|uniref:Uncharacterized protein n=1 Tax=Haematococcus lacustris TaxID=44745 RepID=A0A699ZI24_HAELA|nr:hypothetical protein HaLaN_15565 [Haematococcus lacustris]
MSSGAIAAARQAAHLTALDLGAGFECTLEGLQHLAAAPALQTLTLGNFNIRGLGELRLGGSSVTNAGLASLNKAAHLTALDLGAGFECTLEGLQHLAAAPALQTLTLGNFNIRGLGHKE